MTRILHFVLAAFGLKFKERRQQAHNYDLMRFNIEYIKRMHILSSKQT